MENNKMTAVNKPMGSKTAEETMTSKKLFARLLAKHIGTDEDPDIATEMIGKDSEVTALYNTCLEFSAICNDLTQQQLAEKDKEIERLYGRISELDKKTDELLNNIDALNNAIKQSLNK